jgi:hypothetical protein
VITSSSLELKMTISTDNTWRGDIGVIFDSGNEPWDLEMYRDLIESLTSCFLGENEISEDS